MNTRRETVLLWSSLVVIAAEAGTLIALLIHSLP